MMSSQQAAEPILSTLADDPDLGSIVELYVAEMPGRIATLVEQFDAGNRVGLTTTAHQIKGAAGSHGFHQVTPIAARLEAALHADRPDAEIGDALEALLDICRRVRFR
ncbi:MAG TPA: Hpt domain-containing protein [Pirellulales bacterium]